MPKLQLTDVAVRRIKPPLKPRQVDYWDTLLPAFGLRVSYSGAKTWIVAVRILEAGRWKLTRVSIGTYPTMALAIARDKAREAKAAAQAGKDPRRMRSDERRALEAASVNTFGAVRDRFLRQYSSEHHRPRTATAYKRTLTSADFREWENRPLASITKGDVIALLDSMMEAGTPIKANRVLAYLRKMMNWAASRSLIESAPTDRVDAPAKEVSRDRHLSDQEIAIVWQAFEAAGPFTPLFKLLLVTAQRRDEVAGMRRAEIRDLDGEQPLWVLDKERTKNATAQKVPLPPMAVEIIEGIPESDSDLLFTTNGKTIMSGFSRAKQRVDERIAKLVKEQDLRNVFTQPWRLHDLRRTAKTGMSELGIPPYVSELICNHKRKGIEAVYDHSELLKEKRRALEAWARHVERLTRPATEKVVLLRVGA